MKFPYSMLLDFVETKLNAEAIGDLLTMAGFELEGIEEVDGDSVLDIKVVSNRGDGLSVFGLSREVLAKDESAKPTALYQAAVKGFPGHSFPALPQEKVTIESKDCNRFSSLEVNGIQNGSSPDWIQKRLRQAGQRPISLLVDLSNYLMIELGQPTHSFDLEKLTGECIVIRNAKPGEKLTTLNEIEHENLGGEMMICDAEKPIGAPGVMGGLATEVSANTKRTIIESANFLNTTVRRTRNLLGLNTDASYRFERSVDPEGTVRALNRFYDLLIQVQPNITVVGLGDLYPNKPSTKPIPVRVSRAERLLGVTIGAEATKRHLTRLGFHVEGNGEPYVVSAPSWRPDIVREEDLIEDIGRVHGYELIPEKLPIGTTVRGGVNGFEAFVDHLREAALRAGMNQAICHTLRDVHPLDEEGARVQPRVPASPDTAYLRNSLLPGLSDAAKRNGFDSLSFFEIGRTFDEKGEHVRLAALQVGAINTIHWTKDAAANADFFSLKGAFEHLLDEIGLEAAVAAPKTPAKRLHPTRQAEISANGKALGTIGQIHPLTAEASGLPATTVLAEIDVRAMYDAANHHPKLKQISRNPAVRRDIAILVKKELPYASIESAIGGAADALLERQWLFDVYEGKGVPEGSHSLAIAMQLRKPGANFTDEEANQVRDKVVAALVALGATLR